MLVARLAVATTLAISLVACGTGDSADQLAATRDTAATSGSTPSSPAQSTAVPAELTPVDGTPLLVPPAPPEFDSEGSVVRTHPPEGQSHVVSLKYIVPGPLEGTQLGSLAVTFQNDPAMVAKVADDGLAGLAEVSNLAPPDQTLTAGPHEVLVWRDFDVVPGAGLDRPDKVSDLYAFATAEHAVVQVVTDALSQDEALEFVSAIQVRGTS